MALQIKGKFVENAAIDGDKLELKVGQAIKQKKADGTTVEVIKVVEESGQVVVKANDQEIAFKSQVDGLSTQVATQAQALIAAETAARIADVDAEEARALAAEGVLQSNIDAEETRALAAEAALSAAIASETSSRESADTALDARLDIIEGTGVGSVYKAEVDANQYADSIVLVEKTRAETAEAALSAAITAEEAARIAGDSSTLSSANSYTDTKIAALVDAAPALLDTLNELAAALGDDPNFATSIANSVAAVQTAVEAEETRALAAESALQAEIDAVEGTVSAHNTRLDLLETQDITFAGQLASLQGEIDAEELARATADTALQAEVDAVESALAQELIDRQAGDASTLSSANSYTDTEVGAEEARAVAAEAAIQAEVDAVEAALATETSVREAADTALDGRVDALEAVAHYKEKFVLSAAELAAGYIEFAREAKPSSIVASVGRLMIHEGVGEDFTVSVVAGKTRMTFVGNLVNPSPEELGENDVIYVKYMA